MIIAFDNRDTGYFPTLYDVIEETTEYYIDELLFYNSFAD